MLSELLRVLIQAGMAGSVACVLVLLLRTPWRLHFGAASLLWLWALVPASMLAVLLPNASGSGAQVPTMLPILAAPTELLSLAEPAARAASAGGFASAILLGLWLAGALICAAWFGMAQRRFLDRLGRLRPDGERRLRASRNEVGPAVIGVLRPRIVLPSDFETRFDAEQQALILEHEYSHLQRGDVRVNALSVLLRILFWFNPLFHLAARCLRQDQELASDAAVIARFPRARRRYADTLLVSQLTVPGLPVGCLWQSSHALKERILMMKRDPRTRQRQHLGRAIALMLLGGGCALVWAAQPNAGKHKQQSLTAEVDVSYSEMRPPQYPASAIEAGQQGKVVLRVLVGEDGLAQDVEVESSAPPGVFDLVAIDAIATWRFNPAVRDGKAVASWVLVPMCFSLNENKPDCEAEADHALDGIWTNTQATTLAD